MTIEANIVGPAVGMGATLFRGGRIHISALKAESAAEEIAAEIGQVLQCNRVSILLGAGASFHLGGPHIRAVGASDVSALTASTNNVLDDTEQQLVAALLGEEKRNLEELLSQLGAFAAMGASGPKVEFAVDHLQNSAEVAGSVRRKLTRSLCAACELPRDIPDSRKSSPWRPHQDLLRRLVDSRRSDMSRIRVFTTNYDLAIEHACDSEGIHYVDGFAGVGARAYRPETYQRDVVVRTGRQNPATVPISDFIYLYKLHGSIDWRFVRRGTNEDTLLLQTTDIHRDQDFAVIYPTTEKEAETLGYPYSSLLHHFSAALAEPESALMTIGYGFGDQHVNRVIESALASRSDFQLIVVAPFDVFELIPESERGTDCFDCPGLHEGQVGHWLNTGIARIARLPSPRIQVLTGSPAMFTSCADFIPRANRATQYSGAADAQIRSAFRLSP